MKIDVSVEEYFEQLELIENWYPQEIAMYPWVFMFLQMAERKKRDAQEEYQQVSVLDMHSATDKNINLKGINAFPDFELFNKKEDIIGCVEIKKLFNIVNGKCVIKNISKQEFFNEIPFEKINETYFIKIGKYHNTGDKPRTQYKTKLEINEQQYKKIKNKLEAKKCPLNKEKMIKKALAGATKNIKSTENADVAESYFVDAILKSLDEVILNIKSTENANEAMNHFIDSILEIRKEKELKNNDIVLSIEKRWKRNVCEIETNQKLDIDNPRELIGHIQKFKKVMLTNGLEFCYLKLIYDTKKNKDVIKVECLGNLSSCYEAYKKDPENYDFKSLEKGMEQEEFNNSYIEENKKFIIKDDDGEWTKLIKGLANIAWHE